MVNINIIKTFIIKETKQILRDNSSILIAFILPFILLFLFGFGVNFDTNTVKIGVVNLDNTLTSRDLTEKLVRTRYIKPYFYKTVKEAETALKRDKIRGIVIFPVNFTKLVKSGSRPAEIQIIADGSEPNTAKFVSSYIEGTISPYFKKDKKKITAAQRVWYNPALKSTHFILPGSLSIIMTLTGCILTALVIAREWERGTMEAVLTTEITKGELLCAKYITYFILGLLSVIFSLFLIIAVFRVPFHGSYIALLITSSIFLLTSLGAGLLISTICKDQFVSSQMAGTIGFMPSMMLSGLIYEIDSMPLPIRTLASIIPAKYYVSSVTSLFLSGTIIKTLIINSIYMLIFSILTAYLVYKFTKERIDEC